MRSALISWINELTSAKLLGKGRYRDISCENINYLFDISALIDGDEPYDAWKIIQKLPTTLVNRIPIKLYNWVKVNKDKTRIW